jgi:hypothetical protein
MDIAIGLFLVVFSILLIRYAKSHAASGQKFWQYAVNSVWLPILFTALFGLGVVATFGGVLGLLGT